MMERMDVGPGGPCSNCDGSGQDPKKRTRKCPTCIGSGTKLVCKSCGEDMPCSGTRSDAFDQSQCESVDRS